jgi:hypothetical protein
MSAQSTSAAPATAAATPTIPDPEIDHPPAGDDLRIVQHVTAQGLAAGPGEGPERRRQADLLQRLLGHAPDGGDLVGQVQVQFRRVRRRLQGGVCEDEGAAAFRGRIDHAAASARSGLDEAMASTLR